jgi:sulfofructose kinase
MTAALPIVDVVGVGLNAIDTLLRLPHFPAFDSKVELVDSVRLPGGQVASAMIACRRWGLTARYVGKVGGDDAADIHQAEFDQAGVEAHLIRVGGCRSQYAFILIDAATGERTILWKRDTGLELRPEELDREWIVRARALHVDGHDARAAAQAARWAGEAGIPVSADIDNLYPGVEALLDHTDYLLASRDFPARLTGEPSLLKALPAITRAHGCHVAGVTLGAQGALAWDGQRFHYTPGFLVKAVDTTGAGDIFHAGIVYALMAGWELDRALAFSCAAAALNSTALGARGGIRSVTEIERLMREGQRSEPAFRPQELAAAV